MHFEGGSASGPHDNCNLFVDFIQRSYADAGWVPSDLGPYPVQITVDEVQSVLLELDVSKGAGPDGIPPFILKNVGS
jgi:hypothetical protein